MNTENQDNQEVDDENGVIETPEFVVKEVEEDSHNDYVPEQEEEEEVIEEEVIEEEEEQEDEFFELNEDEAFQFLKQARGLDAESFDDLLTQRESKKFSATAEKYQEYVEKTGNDNISDFLATQKDWSTENPDNVLKQYLKTQNPSLDNEEIDFLFSEKYHTDEDEYDDKAKMRKGINKKVDLKEALSLFEKQKEEYMVNRGSDANIPEEYKNAKAEMDQLYNEFSKNEQQGIGRRDDFVSTTEQVFSNNFEGFKTKIGDSEYVVKPTDIAKTKEAQMNIANFTNKFFDENEKLVDAEGYHKALYFAMNSDKMAEHYFNLGAATRAEQEEKESKNIPDESRLKNVDRPTGSAKFTVREI